jgi:NAD(P)-dependent dehydrogenase (short-subunit alcohol dehydrogenase family)
MAQALVTGANRGIGLELVTQLLTRGDAVVATVRDRARAAALASLGEAFKDRLRILEMDVAVPESVRGALEPLASAGLAVDLLINNAGVSLNPAGRNDTGDEFGTLDAEKFLAVLRVNTLGPLLVAEAAAPLLGRAGRSLVANVSSQLGSIANTHGPARLSYKTSKAALNMISRILAHELAPRGVTVVAIHPGWVRTAMGGDGAPLSTRESVASMLNVLARLTPVDTGRYLNYDGADLPW